jgi:hypothetical protein
MASAQQNQFYRRQCPAKLRWVESGVFRWVLALYRGAGKVILLFSVVFILFIPFPFQVSMAQITGEFCVNWWRGANDSTNSIGAI